LKSQSFLLAEHGIIFLIKIGVYTSGDGSVTAEIPLKITASSSGASEVGSRLI